MNKLELTVTVDLDPIMAAIDSGDLENNDQLFAALATIQREKEAIKAVTDEFDAVEREVKQTINSRAKALYGSDWEAIKGSGYKITRSKTGAKYEIIGEPDAKFLAVSINSEAVDAELKETGHLPAGVGPNHNRGEMIRIAVKDENR